MEPEEPAPKNHNTSEDSFSFNFLQRLEVHVGATKQEVLTVRAGGGEDHEQEGTAGPLDGTTAPQVVERTKTSQDGGERTKISEKKSAGAEVEEGTISTFVEKPKKVSALSFDEVSRGKDQGSTSEDSITEWSGSIGESGTTEWSGSTSEDSMSLHTRRQFLAKARAK